MDIGLAHRVATTDQLLSELAALRARSFPVGQTARATADDKGVNMSGTTTPGGQQPPNPPLHQLQHSRRPDIDAARQAGATQERERIQAVLAVGANLPGHEALLNTLALDGKTTAPEASMAVLKAEGDQRAAAIKAHQDDAPAAAKGSGRTGRQGRQD